MSELSWRASERAGAPSARDSPVGQFARTSTPCCRCCCAAVSRLAPFSAPRSLACRRVSSALAQWPARPGGLNSALVWLCGLGVGVVLLLLLFSSLFPGLWLKPRAARAGPLGWPWRRRHSGTQSAHRVAHNDFLCRAGQLPAAAAGPGLCASVGRAHTQAAPVRAAAHILWPRARTAKRVVSCVQEFAVSCAHDSHRCAKKCSRAPPRMRSVVLANRRRTGHASGSRAHRNGHRRRSAGSCCWPRCRSGAADAELMVLSGAPLLGLPPAGKRCAAASRAAR